MSFILDALKKSEEERLRQQNPSALPAAALRSTSKTPSWVWVLLGLLAINLVVLAFVLLKSATSPPISTPEPLSTVAPTIAPAVDTPMQRAPSAPDASMPPAISTAPTPPSDTRPTPADTPLATVPTRDQQIAAGADLPIATLNLHVYDVDPSKRFILLNGERLRESDASRDGLKVLSITPEGVVLSYGSSSFAVSIEGR